MIHEEDADDQFNGLVASGVEFAGPNLRPSHRRPNAAKSRDPASSNRSNNCRESIRAELVPQIKLTSPRRQT